MRRFLLLLGLTMVVISSQLVHSQAWTPTPKPIATSGGTIQVTNPYGGYNASFEEIISGSPATASVTIQGCMRAGTCDAAADTNTSTTSTIRFVTFPKAYSYFQITASWTGGSNPSIQFWPLVTTSRLGIPASFSFDLPSPSVGDSALYEHKLQNSGQIVRVSCSTDQGTASVNLDIRSESTPNTNGTQVLGSALVCNSNTAITTTLANPIYPANSPVALLISATSGTPSVVRVHVASVISQ